MISETRKSDTCTLLVTLVLGVSSEVTRKGRFSGPAKDVLLIFGTYNRKKTAFN
jgi:hypothetical protein